MFDRLKCMKNLTNFIYLMITNISKILLSNILIKQIFIKYQMKRYHSFLFCVNLIFSTHSCVN